jgi:hypothetical protein
MSPLSALACHLLSAGSLFGLFLNLKMEVTCSSETSVNFQLTTWRYIPKHGTLQYSDLVVNIFLFLKHKTFLFHTTHNLPLNIVTVIQWLVSLVSFWAVTCQETAPPGRRKWEFRRREQTGIRRTARMDCTVPRLHQSLVKGNNRYCLFTFCVTCAPVITTAEPPHLPVCRVS